MIWDVSKSLCPKILLDLPPKSICMIIYSLLLLGTFAALGNSHILYTEYIEYSVVSIFGIFVTWRTYRTCRYTLWIRYFISSYHNIPTKLWHFPFRAVWKKRHGLLLRFPAGNCSLHWRKLVGAMCAEGVALWVFWMGATRISCVTRKTPSCW